MKILFERDNTFEYIAKIYWSLQNGLLQLADLVSYGNKQEFYDENIDSYPEIIKKCYGGFSKPDAIIVDFKYGSLEFKYSGFFEIDREIKRIIIIGDYWSIPCKDRFLEITKKVDLVITLFCEFIDLFPEISEKTIFLPPSVDTNIFKDWRQEKNYLVGFLGSGCGKPTAYYPERYRITSMLKEMYGERFFSAHYPGWGYFREHPLVGEGFSRAINSCQMFLSTSGTIGHCNPKYYEIPASGSALIAGPCKYFEKTKFVDGESCLTFFSDEELIDKIKYYSTRPSEIFNISQKGIEVVKKWHTGFERAKKLIERIDEI